MLPDRADIVVIGGGPAGSTAAAELAMQGRDVVLIDKQHHPRETVGESVLPSAWKYFDRLGVSEEIARRFTRKAGGVVVWGDQISEIAFKDFGYTRPGLHVERDEFDDLLLRNAAAKGARVFEGIRAESVIPGDAPLVVTVDDQGAAHTIACRQVIDASGQAALMGRLTGSRQVNPEFRFVALWGYFADSRYFGAGGIARDFAEIPQHPPLTFVTRLSGWGWSWHIPMKRVTSVGLVIPIDEYKRDLPGHASLEAYFLARCLATPNLRDLLAGARMVDGGVRMMRDFSYTCDVLSGPGFLVTGDAAGFIDPIFSIGVVLALYAGHLAAWAAGRMLDRPAGAAGTRALFDSQMKGRAQLAHAMALPGVAKDPSAPARAYFDYFSANEKALMWSAASMTTRSDNVVRAASGAAGPEVLRRRDHAELRL